MVDTLEGLSLAPVHMSYGFFAGNADSRFDQLLHKGDPQKPALKRPRQQSALSRAIYDYTDTLHVRCPVKGGEILPDPAFPKARWYQKSHIYNVLSIDHFWRSGTKPLIPHLAVCLDEVWPKLEGQRPQRSY